MLKRSISILNLLVVASLCFFGARQLRPHPAEVLATHTPFTVRMSSVMRKVADVAGYGEPKLREYLVAYRADGSTVSANISVAADGETFRVLTRTVHDVSNFRTTVIDEQIRTTSSERLHYTAYKYAVTAPPAVCPAPQNSISDGSGLIDGLEVLKFTSEEPSVRKEVWHAPTLDCFPLLRRYEFKDSAGVLASVTEEIARKVIFGEPDAALFVIPAGYEEVPPSEILKRHGVDVAGDKFAKRDEAYRKLHSLIGTPPLAPPL